MTLRAEDGREGVTNACTEVADGAFSKWKHYWPQLGDANRSRRQEEAIAPI